MKKGKLVPARLHVDRISVNQREGDHAVSLLIEYTMGELFMPSEAIVEGEQYKSVIVMCAIDQGEHTTPILNQYYPYRYVDFANCSGEDWDIFEGAEFLAMVGIGRGPDPVITYLENLPDYDVNSKKTIGDFLNRVAKTGEPYD